LKVRRKTIVEGSKKLVIGSKASQSLEVTVTQDVTWWLGINLESAMVARGGLIKSLQGDFSWKSSSFI